MGKRESVATVAILIDSRPEYLTCSKEPLSLLQLPLGTGTILSHLVSQVAAVGAGEVVIMPTFAKGPDYASAIAGVSRNGERIVRANDLSSVLHGHEPSDSVLVVDARYWPTDGFDFDPMVRNRKDHRWTMHAVAVPFDGDGTNERILCDRIGRVQRIRRYYNRVTWPQMGEISWSLVPLPAIEKISFSSLSDLRRTLSERGMLTHDVSLSSGIINLTHARVLLALNERTILQDVGKSVPSGYRLTAPGVLVGNGCEIDPSAKIVGPVIVQDRVRVEERATIIGPTVLGADSQVCRRSLIAQSVVVHGNVVSEGTVERQQLFSGDIHSTALHPGLRMVEAPVRFDSGSLHEFTAASLRAAKSSDAGGRRVVYSATKRAVDIAVALFGLIVLSPLMLVTAILIKLESRGPVLFSHEREGKGGEVFGCLKFRTMRKDAHQHQRELYKESVVDGPQFKLREDPRVTRVGRWLRKTNIDEIPQLINVLKGEMSVIGPRPSPFRENQICVPWRRARLAVRPGITGLWQVCRSNRSTGDFHQWIFYDILYVRHRSFLLEAKIFGATLLTLGARWSTPLSWMIPPRVLNAEYQSFLEVLIPDNRRA